MHLPEGLGTRACARLRYPQPLHRPPHICACPFTGSALVTEELKKLSTDELREGGGKYRELLEQRDWEDAMAENAILGEDSSGCSCIWGNPCVAPHACKDWKNRFDVAKQHGWKGF